VSVKTFGSFVIYVASRLKYFYTCIYVG